MFPNVQISNRGGTNVRIIQHYKNLAHEIKMIKQSIKGRNEISFWWEEFNLCFNKIVNWCSIRKCCQARN